MYLAALPVLGQEIIIHVVKVTFLFVGATLQIFVSILAFFTYWEDAVGEELVDLGAGRGGLGGDWSSGLLLSLLLLLLLLCGNCLCVGC